MYTEEFERFWKAYPTRWNKDLSCYIKRKKRPAFEKWQKLSVAIRNECFAKVHLIKQSEGIGVRDCVTWLNQWGWEDIELPKLPVKHLPKELTGKVKTVESHIVNSGNERNRQKDKLSVADGRKEYIK